MNVCMYHHRQKRIAVCLKYRFVKCSLCYRYMVVVNFETFWIDLTSPVLKAETPLLNVVPAEQVCSWDLLRLVCIFYSLVAFL